MPNDEKINFLRLDELNHVEAPFLKQLEEMPGLHWNVLRLEMGNTQTPQESQRDDFAQVLMMKDLKTAIKRINPWISDEQLFELSVTSLLLIPIVYTKTIKPF
jgi:type I restriction enzyme R subunit